MGRMMTFRGGQWVPWCPGGDPTEPVDLARRTIQRAMIGLSFRPYGWRPTLAGTILLRCWLDHWRGTSPVWGLLYQQQTTNPITQGDAAYAVSQSSNMLRVPYVDRGEIKMQNISLPYNRTTPHYYWFNEAGSSVGILTASTTTRPRDPDNTTLSGATVADHTQWRYGGEWVGEFPLPVPFTVYGYAGTTYAMTPADMCGTINTIGNYTQKPGMTDADFFR